MYRYSNKKQKKNKTTENEAKCITDCIPGEYDYWEIAR